ncbi:hypothetical protein GCM10009837_60530 [Streptomyces durmitorensis]
MLPVPGEPVKRGAFTVQARAVLTGVSEAAACPAAAVMPLPRSKADAANAPILAFRMVFPLSRHGCCGQDRKLQTEPFVPRHAVV